MASYTVAAADAAKQAFTLTATTVDTVTLTGYTRAVDIITDGAAVAYYTTDGSTPTVAGPNTRILPAAAAVAHVNLGSVNGDGVVKVISSGTPTLSVEKSG